ncbi:AAA domain, putative abiEii toxin, type IV TA system domain-containing protein [Phthorimaea operculella]|nr:AAA domain, putative abiEii toxin, type IV TA system domain-containing protein [Phthorimaea operculella]
MITAKEMPTRGKVMANNVFLKWMRNSTYLTNMSHCPQFAGLDFFDTGHNNITTILMLRGLNKQDASREADVWIDVVGLGRYRNLPVEGYSGGCLRRLACAAALSSGAPITLLDEPTSGVDVSARRRVWVALKKGLRDNRAVIITSHSMDEMETLCDRIAIMVDGKVAALGSAPALRAAHATGHSLSIKVTPGVHPDDFQLLKEKLMTTFDCTLVDERATMLQYHINVPMRYSEIFAILEDLKRSFEPSIIEDYSVSETTLEEVFLSFAKKPEPVRGAAAAPKKSMNPLAGVFKSK